MEIQADMFNRMCSVRSSEMSIEEPECKDLIDDNADALGIFNSQLWKDPGSSKRDYGVNIFHDTYDKSESLLSKDNDL